MPDVPLPHVAAPTIDGCAVPRRAGHDIVAVRQRVTPPLPTLSLGGIADCRLVAADNVMARRPRANDPPHRTDIGFRAAVVPQRTGHDIVAIRQRSHATAADAVTVGGSDQAVAAPTGGWSGRARRPTSLHLRRVAGAVAPRRTGDDIVAVRQRRHATTAQAVAGRSLRRGCSPRRRCRSCWPVPLAHVTAPTSAEPPLLQTGLTTT